MLDLGCWLDTAATAASSRHSTSRPNWRLNAAMSLQPDASDIEAIVEVLAKAALGHVALEAAMGGGK